MAARAIAQPAPGPLRDDARRLLARLFSQLPRAVEHGVDHRLGELAGEGVLLAGVIAADQRVERASRLDPVSEPRAWARRQLTDIKLAAPKLVRATPYKAQRNLINRSFTAF